VEYSWVCGGSGNAHSSAAVSAFVTFVCPAAFALPSRAHAPKDNSPGGALPRRR
jgi:hypothetical protein